MRVSIVSPDWLETHLHDPGLSVVDASWYLPAQNRDARAEYDAAHIPGAIFFDQDAVVDPDSALPHTLPSPTEFERHASAMGIGRTDTIVVYDGPGMFTAPRVWWMFRVMGADKVFVLDGMEADLLLVAAIVASIGVVVPMVVNEVAR